MGRSSLVFLQALSEASHFLQGKSNPTVFRSARETNGFFGGFGAPWIWIRKERLGVLFVLGLECEGGRKDRFRSLSFHCREREIERWRERDGEGSLYTGVVWRESLAGRLTWLCRGDVADSAIKVFLFLPLLPRRIRCTMVWPTFHIS